MTCQVCGLDVQHARAFCPACGTRLPTREVEAAGDAAQVADPVPQAGGEQRPRDAWDVSHVARGSSVEPRPAVARPIWPKVLLGVLLVVGLGGALSVYAYFAMIGNAVDDLLALPTDSSRGVGDDGTGEGSGTATEAPKSDAQTVSTRSGGHVWTYTNELGYTVRGVLSVGDAVPITDSTPDVRLAEARASAGDVCSLEVGRDAVIPMQALLTNTSEDFSVGMSMTLSFAGQFGSGNPTISLAQVFSSEDSCEGAEIGSGDGGWGVSWKDPIEPGSSGTAQGYLVLSDYFTPEHPDGNEEWLRTVTAQVLPTTNSTTSDRFVVEGESSLPIGAELAGPAPLAPRPLPSSTDGMYEVIAKTDLVVRDGPSVDAEELARVDRGEFVHIVCVTGGDAVEDATGRMISNWDRIDYPFEGYVSDAFVDTFGERAPVPDC